jgi:hypothetical protein
MSLGADTWSSLMHCDSTSARRMAAPMSPDIASGLAARNLKLLEAIEETITSLSNDLELLELVANGFSGIFDKFTKEPPNVPIDTTGAIDGLLDSAAAACGRLYADAVHKHRAAGQDPHLTPEDGVEEAYNAFIQCINGTHDCIEELREWIALHDALFEETTGGKYSNVEDLFAAMGL